MKALGQSLNSIAILKKDFFSMSESAIICFLADRHDLYDDRIYWKMAVPLVKRGYSVHYYLIGKTDEKGITKEGIHFKIFKLKTFSPNRFLNFVFKRVNPNNNYKLLFKEAKSLKADIYHFHDLWINRLGPKLKNLNHHPVVFYDAREPYADDYVSYVKSPIPWIVKAFASWVDSWEKKQARHYDMVISNEITVQRNFAKKIGEDRTAVLYNYSDMIDLATDLPPKDKTYDLIYCGAITELRGAFEMTKAIKKAREQFPEIKALFLGNYYPLSIKDQLSDMLKKEGLADNIILHEAVPYQRVADYYNKSKIGLVLLQKVKTFEVSMPIKIFEYMAFGLPIIGSNFGHMKDYIQRDKCGIAVKPNDTESISRAIVKILKDEELYMKYSKNGRMAAKSKYRWELEFKKLIGYYKTALDARK